MDPKHRDRVAFVRLCSGHFQRGMKLTHVRTGKPMAMANPVLFLARDRELAEDAWAGDIIGIPNHGQLRIGDALTEGEALRFTGIPSFAPELLQAVRAADPMKAKHLEKALNQFAEEGASKLFKPQIGSGWIVGVVGPLQFDVLASRIEQEYGLPVRFEPTQFTSARWVSGPRERIDDFATRQQGPHGRGPRRRPGLHDPPAMGHRPRRPRLARDPAHRHQGDHGLSDRPRIAAPVCLQNVRCVQTLSRRRNATFQPLAPLTRAVDVTAA